jgi:DNA-binding transcriptional MerR regulator
VGKIGPTDQEGQALVATADANDLLALPAERAAKLAGVSLRQLRYWDETGLAVPSIKRQLDARTTVRLYAFPDLVELLAVAAMRRQGISLQHVRRVIDHLRTGGYGAPLRELRFAIHRDEVFFQHPDGSWEGDHVPGQIVLAHVIPLEEIATHIRRAAQREVQAAGQVARRHKVMGRQPVFEGTRIPLATVVGYLDRGYTTEQIIEAFPALTPADVQTARQRGSVA